MNSYIVSSFKGFYKNIDQKKSCKAKIFIDIHPVKPPSSWLVNTRDLTTWAYEIIPYTPKTNIEPENQQF